MFVDELCLISMGTVRVRGVVFVFGYTTSANFGAMIMGDLKGDFGLPQGGSKTSLYAKQGEQLFTFYS